MLSATGGPYRSPVWDGPVIWDQPTSIRLEGGMLINNLDVYPNHLETYSMCHSHLKTFRI